MESLERLDRDLREKNMKNIYLFCSTAKSNEARIWIDDMVSKGVGVFFLEENHNQSIELVKKIIVEEDVVLVHTHFITTEQFGIVDSAVPKWIPVIMHMHNHSKRGNVVKTLMRRYYYRRCIMIACSDSVFQSIKRDYPRHEKYSVDNGVNFDRLEDYQTILPEEYGIEPDEKILLIFGFDFYRKGVDLAIKAVELLRKEGEKYFLLISLSTNFEFVEEEIKKIMGEMPRWAKVIKARSDVASLYNLTDLFLSPSREEGLPYSVIEAEYCKCSVVLSDISAQRNLKLVNAYWFKEESVNDLARQIQKAYKEHHEKLENLETIKEHMRENYSLSEWSKKIIEIYDKVLRR